MDTIKRTVFGVGYSSEGPYKKTVNRKTTKAYANWQNMLKRCYCPKEHSRKPTYLNCTAVDEWHDYQAFAKWHEDNYIEGYQLDKDIVNPGNKIYGPNTCYYVPSQINNVLSDSKAIRGDLPQGVSLYKSTGRYVVHIKERGKLKHLGYFESIEEAAQVYKEAKEAYVKEIANQWKGKIHVDVYNALMNWLLVIG